MKCRDFKVFGIAGWGVTCFLASAIGAIESGEEPSELPPVAVIPFQLSSQNNLIVQATLNGQDTVDLMFHTGVTGVSLIRSAADKVPSVAWNQSAAVTTWGGEAEARFSESNALRIGDLEWEGVSLTEGLLSGERTDGKFGPNLFGERVLEIDFDRQVLVVHEKLPKSLDGFESLPLEIGETGLWVAVRLQVGEEWLTNDFMIHTGYRGTALLDDTFVKAHDLSERLPVLSESELRDSHGNVLKTRKVLLSSLCFGDDCFDDVPVGLFAGAIRRQPISVVGGDLLKRFHLVLDFPGSRLWLRPNARFEDAWS